MIWHGLTGQRGLISPSRRWLVLRLGEQGQVKAAAGQACGRSPAVREWAPCHLRRRLLLHRIRRAQRKSHGRGTPGVRGGDRLGGAIDIDGELYMCRGRLTFT